MRKIKIKKAYTFWWTTVLCQANPELIIGEMSLGRPTVAFHLLTGEYLYIDAYRIKEMIWCAEKEPKGDTDGLQDGGGMGETGAE